MLLQGSQMLATVSIQEVSRVRMKGHLLKAASSVCCSRMLLPPFSQHPATASFPVLSRSATALAYHCHRYLAGFTSIPKPGDVALAAPVSAVTVHARPACYSGCARVGRIWGWGTNAALLSPKMLSQTLGNVVLAQTRVPSSPIPLICKAVVVPTCQVGTSWHLGSSSSKSQMRSLLPKGNDFICHQVLHRVSFVWKCEHVLWYKSSCI
jgi:hypothetical protein